MKHYNSGNCWGKVESVKLEKSDKGTPYLSIILECPNDLYGNIKTYGRLWGKDKIDAFLDHHKKNLGASYRFQGFFSQYTKNGRRNSNYTFFSWQIFTGTELRATFILTGEVTAAEIVENEGKIFIHLDREGKGDYEDIQEDFEIYTLNTQDIAGIHAGDIIQVKGCIAHKEPEDYFGSSPNGPVRPYCKEINVLQSKEVF